MTDEEKKQINDLRAEGLGYRKIAQLTGVKADTVKSYLRRHREVPGPGQCPQCGKPIVQDPHRKRKKYCSDECRLKWWAAHPEKLNRTVSYNHVCKWCGKEYITYGKNSTYCSRSCFAEARKQDYKEMREKADSFTAPCGTELSNLPSHCLCASCQWFTNGRRACPCKKALAGEI